MPGQIPAAVKDARLAVLQALLNKQARTFAEACVGRELDVLLTGPGRHSGQLVGRSPYLQSVHVNADAHHIGTIMTLKIVSAGSNSLAGVTAR
jgi:tRNA-2-methylthio-N6-dimethylallyladenosine synthase